MPSVPTLPTTPPDSSPPITSSTLLRLHRHSNSLSGHGNAIELLPLTAGSSDEHLHAPAEPPTSTTSEYYDHRMELRLGERDVEGMEGFSREENIFMAGSFGAVVVLSVVSGLITLKVICGGREGNIWIYPCLTFSFATTDDHPT
ncbi:hypothetical protein DACRYDRAFT_22470 [Dacryopinax primogenitus]|uniref:Uncharacterized protein n=1 Tax=Dacryopinax primogenitus (strain DJM 731) TaxID=1858805 RepID=M5FXN8_DACPD|nr:uncharacterized protein DACRYDRAFT_22470 [Dacryopinax primogenitus]EJU01249.1 hypothetical protein DACRYDRAFT_22470 [Dacryopinax primogenitus]